MTGSLDQIVIDPEDRTDALMEAVSRLAEENPPHIGWRLWVYLAMRRMAHPMVHTFVRMKQYDKASNRLIETGWLVCMFCSRVKIRKYRR